MANKMNESTLKVILDAELNGSLGYLAGELSGQRSMALNYYNGEPYGDEVENRSQIITRDVLETVETVLPAILNTFVSSKDAVVFDPVGKGDEEAAAQETDYVNYVFYKKNPGFLILYSFVKDALLQKNGIVKIYWDDKTEESKEEYEGLNILQLSQLLDDPELEIISQTESEIMGHMMPDGPMPGSMPGAQAFAMPTYNVTVKRTKKRGQVVLANVPPEEFLVSKRSTSVIVDDAPFVAHRSKKTISELVRAGYDRGILEKISSADDMQTEEEMARKNLDDESGADDSLDASMREVWVNECYIRVDYDGDGVAELRKVTKAGDYILDNEEIDYIPFVTTAPIINPHKWAGTSLADVVMDLQRINSSLMRQIFDNLYFINNSRTAVSDKVNLDDLLSVRPGGVVRLEDGAIPGEGHLMPIATAQIPPQAFELVQWLDNAKELRTGANRSMAGLNADMLNNNKGDMSVERMMGAAEKRVQLMARIIAETGVKPMSLKIRELLRKHQDQESVVRLRDKWVAVDPREWRDRYDMTVNVGLGTGDKTRLAMATKAIMDIQAQYLQMGGGGVLVTEDNQYKAAIRLGKYADLEGVDDFFNNPNNEIAAQTKQARSQQQDPTQKILELQAQVEMMKAQTERMKIEADSRVKEAEMARKYEEMNQALLMKMTELELQFKQNVPGSAV